MKAALHAMKMAFYRTAPTRRVAQLHDEAVLAAIEHRAAAEHHGALAKMFEDRADRLAPLIPINAPKAKQ